MLTDGSLVSDSSADYCKLEEVLHANFGSEGCRFLLFDWLRRDPTLFARSLGEFVGTSSDLVESLIARSRRENVRRSGTTNDGLKVRRQNLQFILDQAKKLVLPNRSLGVGRLVRPLLGRVEFGIERFVPQAADLERLRTRYADSNARLVSRHPELSMLLKYSEVAA